MEPSWQVNIAATKLKNPVLNTFSTFGSGFARI